LEVAMTRMGVKEYVDALRDRYLRGSKKEKGKVLDEFVRVVGCHRKSAVRLLGREKKASHRGNSGRGRLYRGEVVDVLRLAWEATDHLCSKRLQPFLPELVPVLRRYGNRPISPEVAGDLCRMSPSTIDRLLGPWRRDAGHHRFSITKPGTLLKSAIPIKTFAEWEDGRPGFLEVDLVHHCGESVDGFYLTTLSAVDVATGWSECVAVWGKNQERVGSAIHRMRQRLPFPFLGLDSDNGSEFINRHLLTYCQKEHITFTRSRSYKKNDSCYVEQKNWSVVRRIIGYDRYSTKPSLETMNRIYEILRLYVNFFQPTMKLCGKTRHGSKIHRVYAPAQTPYRRLLACGVLTEDMRQGLAATYAGLNPFLLRQRIDENLKQLWDLADKPGSQSITTDKTTYGNTQL
jgi:hypothetical protein